LLLATQADAIALGVAERDADAAAGIGSIAEDVDEIGQQLLVQERRGVDEDVDRALSVVEELAPQLRRDVGSVWVEREQLGLACFLGAPVGDVGPEVGLLLAQELDELPAVASVRHASVEPALHGLRID